ncbi:HAD family hydrolase [Magnetovibrio sp. PR-2]|uniref:HAD family hydrolase n=1 Tax=Magnetovibrio sp. PR-2 TaxID=3120356 RepID=UPI002FCE2698
MVFSDIDDTLTWEGRLPPEVLQALQRLKDAGIIVVPITGGCAGWADCFVRTWPVQTVITENGSFWLHQDHNNHVHRHFLCGEAERKANFDRLMELSEDFRKRFPMIDFAQDQDFRLTDIAFDIGQQASIARELAEQATHWWLEQGVTARFSSIHINVWIGDYNKATAAKAWLDQQDGITAEQCAFIGDSPNDETMFAEFKNTIGVANIQRYLKLMPQGPKFITQGKGGFGFCEFAESLLART